MRQHDTATERPAASTGAPPTGRPPLERSESHRVIAGVCGGLGRHLDIDPVVFRVVLAVLCLSGGIGLFIYGLAWLIVPIAGSGRNELQRLLNGRVDMQSLGAMLVTVLGTGVLFTYMNQGNHFFPLLLIAFLTFAALRYDPAKHQRGTERSAARDPEAPPPPPAPTAPVPPATPAWWQREDPLLKDYAPVSPARFVPGPAAPGEPPGGVPPAAAFPGTAGPFAGAGADHAGPAGPAPVPAPDTRDGWDGRGSGRRGRGPGRERPVLAWLTLLLAAAAGAGVWLAQDARHHGHNLLAVLGSALLVLGLGLLVGARWGRARRLAVPALLLTLLLAAVASVSPDLRTAQRAVVWAPVSAARLHSPYELGTGTARLDLSRIDPAGGTVAATARMGAGRLTVVLPPHVEVHLAARTGFGEIVLPDGGTLHGVGRAASVDLLPAGASRGVLDLTVELGFGRLEVTR